MSVKKGKNAKGKAKTLAARTLSHKHADEIKGGKNCCAGAHYQKVIIEMRKAGGDPK